MTRNLLLRCSTLLLLLAVGGSGTLAETVRADDESASRSVERRLRQEPFPWFSAENQEFVFLPPSPEENDEPPKKSSEREFDWLFRIFWGIAAVVVGILSLLVVWSVVRLRLDKVVRKNATRNDDNQKRRLEALSPEAQDRIGDLLQAANDSRQGGDFQKAIIYYFSYLLVRLDENGSIRMRRGKTNLDYANEIAGSAELASFYNAASELFDRTYYGNYPIAADDFDSVWNVRDDFQNALLKSRPTKNVSQFPTTLAAPSIPIPSFPATNSEIAEAEIAEADSDDDASSKSADGFRRFWGVLIAAAFWAGTFGCNQEKVWKEEYRDVVPPSRFEKSVNGDSLFRAICRGEGNGVKAKRQLPRRLDNVDVVVWHLPPEYYNFVQKINFDDLVDEKSDGSGGSVAESKDDDFDLFFKIQRFYKQWLEAKPGRSLVLVLPGEFADFDFWQTIEKIAPDDQKGWVRSQIELQRSALPGEFPLFGRPLPNVRRDEKETGTTDRLSQTAGDGEKVVEISGSQNRWFDVELFKEPRTTVGLTGDPYWTQGISPEWRHFCSFRVRPLEESDVLLRSEDVPIVCSRRVGESRIFIVSTEKPFLNYYLIDVENRKLAGRLVDFWGRDKNILIVKNAGGFPRSLAQPPNESAFKLTETSPYSALVWRLIWVATLICFALFPILGRPKRIPEAKLADFSRHIDAYGAALRRTNDVDQAKKQIDRFRRRRE